VAFITATSAKGNRKQNKTAINKMTGTGEIITKYLVSTSKKLMINSKTFPN